MSDKLTKVESGAMAAPSGNMDIEAVIRHAIDKGMTPEMMQGFMVIRRELRAEQAKAEFDAALAAFQSECPIIVKRKAVMNKDGRSIRYKYAPLDDIVEQVKDLLNKHGFSFSINSPTEPGKVKSVCMVKHKGGHSVPSEFEVPIDKEAYMNVQQQYAAALTFTKRYAFTNGFGILTADEDIDAQGEKPKPPGPSSLHGDKAPTATDAENKRKLTDMTRSIHFAQGYNMNDDAKNKLTQWLIDEAFISDTQTVSDLSGAALAAVVAKVQAKLQPR